MSDYTKSNSETLKSEESIIHGQTNPSFHDTPEDAENYKSLQNKPQIAVKKSLFVLKPSILTQKAEEIRTDKAAVKEKMTNLSTSNKFLVLGNERKNELNDKPVKTELVKVEEPSGGYIFGENIFDRVVNTEASKDTDKGVKEFKDFSGDSVNQYGTGENDSDALRKNAEVATQKPTTQTLQETEMITGEEDELSVLKLSCKVFLFSNDRHEWVEKGFCFVHVNESKTSSDHKARLVARSKGGLKVIINTFIWSEMVVTRASDKSLRITAQGEDGVKSYLLTMLNNTDADVLYHVLFCRKTLDNSKCGSKTNRKRDLSSSDNDDSFESKKRILSDDE